MIRTSALVARDTFSKLRLFSNLDCSASLRAYAQQQVPVQAKTPRVHRHTTNKKSHENFCWRGAALLNEEGGAAISVPGLGLGSSGYFRGSFPPLTNGVAPNGQWSWPVPS